MDKIDYKKTNKYWNDTLKQKKIGRFPTGFVMPAELEDIAFYRFKKELVFLNRFGKFGPLDSPQQSSGQATRDKGNYLELGCGTGNLLHEWRNKFDHLIGIDFSDSLIKIARKQCLNLKNVSIFKDNALNFEKYIGNKKFKFIFVGGCFMYLNDDDVLGLIGSLFQKLTNDGVLIFREPTAAKKRIYEKEIGIRRTIDEYKSLICPNKDSYMLKIYQNYSVNYTHLIALYLKLFPFLKNRISLFENPVAEFFLLYLPLKFYTKLKRNMVLYHFFVVSKNSQDCHPRASVFW